MQGLETCHVLIQGIAIRVSSCTSLTFTPDWLAYGKYIAPRNRPGSPVQVVAVVWPTITATEDDKYIVVLDRHQTRHIPFREVVSSWVPVDIDGV